MLLKIAHVEDAHEPRYVVVQEPASYVIGFRAGSDVMLTDSTVAAHHVRLTLESGRIFVEPLAGNPTLVDEHAIHDATEVTLGQWIQLGETVLQVLRGDRPPPRNHDEQRAPSGEEDGFLATLRLDPSDDEARLVYADWLEAAESPVTAAYVRLELAGTVDITTSELVERATAITKPEWRALICRGPIGHCERGRRCRGRWHLLAPTRDPFTRDCTSCEQPVHYCADHAAVAHHGERRARVVFDARLGVADGTDTYVFGLHADAEERRAVPSLFAVADDTLGDDGDDDLF